MQRWKRCSTQKLVKMTVEGVRFDPNAVLITAQPQFSPDDARDLDDPRGRAAIHGAFCDRNSPLHLHQRQSLPGQFDLQVRGAVRNTNTLRRIQRLQLSGGFQLFVLIGGRRRRGAHGFPRGESIAVVGVDAEVLQFSVL